MPYTRFLALLTFLSASAVVGRVPDLPIPDALIRDILTEVSSEAALEHTRALASRVRYPGSRGFFESAEYVAAQARLLGLANVRIERLPGERPSWDPVAGELELVEPERRRLASFQDTAVLIAEGSMEGDVTAELVDVGQGSSEAAYAGKDVRGKILLADGSPGRVWQAMGQRGAVGVLSAGSEGFFGRRPAEDAVSWGQSPPGALAMMISRKQAEELRRMLRQGKTVRLRMRVQANRSEQAEIGMVMGEIPGEVKGRDVVLVSHLDHQKPGANDNASGSGTLLEALATLQRLVAAGKVPPLRRTLRFWWSTEIASEKAFFQRYPQEARNILLAVNLDQAGGDRNAENNFAVIYGPEWLPSFDDDLIYSLAEHMKDRYAPAERAPSPLFVSPRGSRTSFRPAYWKNMPLSDHVAFQAKGVGIPCISMGVPSLHVIHTDQDSVDRIDPTWLKRSALMTLAPALWAANAGPAEARTLLDYVFGRARVRLAEYADPKKQLELEEQRLDSARALDAGLVSEPYKQKLRALAEVLSRE